MSSTIYIIFAMFLLLIIEVITFVVQEVKDKRGTLTDNAALNCTTIIFCCWIGTIILLILNIFV